MIKLRWKKKWIAFESVTWSGTHNQCSRQLDFTIPCNPYDKEFKNQSIKLGDLIYLYDGSTQLFVGTVTSREKSAEIGTASYVAMDFMHHLLRSTGTYKFRRTTPEKVVKKICSDLKIGTTNLAKTKTNIEKIFFEDQGLYNIMVRVYRKAKAKTGKTYMPKMVGKKVSVIQKGTSSGVTLTQGVDITAATYSDTTDNMVNVVKIYSDSMKKLGQVRNKGTVETYGVYQQVYTKEKGVNAKKEAKAMMIGVTKEASVEAIGNVKAISGYSIMIKDKATGLTGKFYITSDSHTFENGTHVMSLGLSWKNESEEGAETASTSSQKASKKTVTNDAKCFYLESGSVYHASTTCSSCKGKAVKKSTVAAMKKVKISKGKNKGKRKYKPCSKCWKT